MPVMKPPRHFLEVQREFINVIGDGLSRIANINRIAGQVLAALYLHDGDTPLGANDLAELLKISRSTLSTALAELQAGHLIKRCTPIGSRKELFTTASDVWELYAATLKGRLNSYKVEMDLIEKLQHRLKSEERGEESRRLLRRLDNALDLFSVLERMLQALAALSPKELRESMERKKV